MWTALLLVMLTVTAAVALVARAVADDAFGQLPEDERWMQDTFWWL